MDTRRFSGRVLLCFTSISYRGFVFTLNILSGEGNYAYESSG